MYIQHMCMPICVHMYIQHMCMPICVRIHIQHIFMPICVRIHIQHICVPTAVFTYTDMCTFSHTAHIYAYMCTYSHTACIYAYMCTCLPVVRMSCARACCVDARAVWLCKRTYVHAYTHTGAYVLRLLRDLFLCKHTYCMDIHIFLVQAYILYTEIPTIIDPVALG